MPAKKIKTNHAARSFKTKTNKDMPSHWKSRNRGTKSEFPRGDGRSGRPKTRGRPLILLGQDMIGHIGFLWSRGQRYRAWIKNGDLEKKCHCYLYVPLAALIPLAIAHNKRVHKYKHAIQANTSGRMFLLLANVISVPGMNTFIEPKHTLQSHNPYANVIGIGECGQRSDLERFIKGLYNLRRRMGYIGKSVYFVILQGRIAFNYTDGEREVWLCIPCWFSISVDTKRLSISKQKKISCDL